jgi:Transposase DDE domain
MKYAVETATYGYAFSISVRTTDFMNQLACTPSTHRTLKINWYEDVREHVRKLSQTAEFEAARRARNKIEAPFSELRNQIRLRRLRLRGLAQAGEQFFLAATVQNIPKSK